jgi:hypothetical protein
MINSHDTASRLPFLSPEQAESPSRLGAVC